jgi:hypothetical protein
MRGLSDVEVCQNLGFVSTSVRFARASTCFPVIAGVASGAWVFCALGKSEPMFAGAQSFARGRGKVSYGK